MTGPPSCCLQQLSEASARLPDGGDAACRDDGGFAARWDAVVCSLTFAGSSGMGRWKTAPHRQMFVPAHGECLFSILLEHPSRWIPHRVGEHHLDQSLPRHGLYGRHDDSRCARFLTTR